MNIKVCLDVWAGGRRSSPSPSRKAYNNRFPRADFMPAVSWANPLVLRAGFSFFRVGGHQEHIFHLKRSVADYHADKTKENFPEKLSIRSTAFDESRFISSGNLLRSAIIRLKKVKSHAITNSRGISLARIIPSFIF